MMQFEKALCERLLVIQFEKLCVRLLVIQFESFCVRDLSQRFLGLACAGHMPNRFCSLSATLYLSSLILLYILRSQLTFHP